MTVVEVRPRGVPVRSRDAELAARPSATGGDRIVSLDGLRAVGVLLIMGFHFGVGWLPGGFVGVDVFYVLSGYLITGLLVGEFRGRGRIRLSSFWARRARRLLPALVIVLVATTLLVRYDAAPGLYPNFRMSALSSLFYFSNWWQIGASGNYFAVTGPPSPLTHTWSLAVEEQFYLVWPLVVLAVMFAARRFTRGVKLLLAVSLAGVVASGLEMALRYGPGADTTRLYFGTDTHAQSVMVGAALACLLTLVQLRRGSDGMAPAARSRWARVTLAALGVAGFAGVVVLSLDLEGTGAFTYRGGILLAALSSAGLVVAAVCLPGGWLAEGLSVRSLVWVGTVSYGAYLWHYPVFVFLDAPDTGLSGLGLLAARFAATFAVAGLSYYLVERPIMIGTFWRSLRAVVPSSAAVLSAVAVIVAGTAAPAVASVAVHRYQALPFTTVTGAPPPLVVVLGDSTAETLGVALQRTAPAGTQVVDAGLFGCGMAMGSSVSNDPPTPQLGMFPACNEASPPAEQWPALDARAVEPAATGDLVLFVAGSWEVQDLLQHGRWTNITQPSFQRDELARLRQVVAMATAHGAHLELATMPALAVGASFHQRPFPEDSPARRRIYDGLVRTVADEYPRQVSVVDLGALLSPGGVFRPSLDGVEVRTPDGVHTPAYAPGNPYADNSSPGVAESFDNWLSPRIWPRLLAAGPGAGVAASTPAGLPPAEEAALRTSGAFGRHPIRFVLVGDSIAETLAQGLGRGSVGRFGVALDDQTALGCDLDDLDAITDGQLDIPVSPCAHWPTLWRSVVQREHPDVVGLLVGRWDVTDHIEAGRIVHIGEPAWDAHLEGELSDAVSVLSSTGAKVVLFTMPYFGVPPTPNGVTYPENGPVRIGEFNRLLSAVARSHPRVVTLIDLNRLLDPNGTFQSAVDGVTVRWADGIHISEAGGEWLQPAILPAVARSGLEHRGQPIGPSGPSVPAGRAGSAGSAALDGATGARARS